MIKTCLANLLLFHFNFISYSIHPLYISMTMPEKLKNFEFNAPMLSDQCKGQLDSGYGDWWVIDLGVVYLFWFDFRVKDQQPTKYSPWLV